MKVTIKGLGRLKNKVGKLPKLIEEGYMNADTEIVEAIEGLAKSRLQANTQHSQGNTNYVKSEVREEGGNKVSSIYTDKDTNIYKELGTGPVGESSQKDMPTDFHPVYTQKPWFFPVASVDMDLTALYGMRKLKLGDAEFYMSSGQPARPWLYPSYRDVMEKSDQIYKRNISEAIRKGL